jgi:hypothetical protein
MKLVKAEKIGISAWRLTVKKLWRERVFEGSGTVFHDVETGRRCLTEEEHRLSEMLWLAERDAK